MQWKHWEKERFRAVRNIVSVPKHSVDIVFNGHHILSVVYLTVNCGMQNKSQKKSNPDMLLYQEEIFSGALRLVILKFWEEGLRKFKNP